MTRLVGDELPQAMVERFSQRDLGSRLGVALPFVTVDTNNRPHPMLLSYLELRAYDARSIGLVIAARSRSARNLVDRHAGTLLIIEPDITVYVKTRALDMALPVSGGEAWDLGFFLLAVEEVIEDTAAEWEDSMRIVHPVEYRPTPTLEEPWAQVTLAALAAPRARV